MYIKLPPEVINSIKELLTKLQPGQLPFEIFTEVVRLTVTPVVEVVPLKVKPDGTLNVLLEKRPVDDPNWPGMLHVPGSIVLPTDTSGAFKEALDRIVTGKLKLIKANDPIFVESVLCNVSRGTEVALVYYLDIDNEPTTIELYDVSNLPENLIEGHADFIKTAVQMYRAGQR